MSDGKRIFLIAGEHSGDFLGAALMRSLDQQLDPSPVYAGVGGDQMEAQGLHSLFPLDDVAVMGISAVIPRLPTLYKRGMEAVEAAIRFNPDVVVAIDSPEFTHAIARRIRKRRTDLPIINYVSPSVWAWRSGRARKMRRYIDHVLALLPFEPEAHQRLGGPSCTYVGHPLIEKLPYMQSCDPVALRERLGISDGAPVLLVLPGSRSNEVLRLMAPFGETVIALRQYIPDLEIVIPVVDSVRQLVEQERDKWQVEPHLVSGEDDKFAAFNLADAALAASGTVTLELALAEVPMVVAYRVSRLESSLRGLIEVPSIVLANLVLQENLFPEFIQENCTPDHLAPALMDLLQDSEVLAKQKNGLRQIVERMQLPQGTPADAAAEVVASYLAD
jgi:lipid-A-disaccharide synthase